MDDLKSDLKPTPATDKPQPLAAARPTSTTSEKPAEVGHVGDKVSADAEAGKEEENRRREADLPAKVETAEPPKPMTAGEAKVLTTVADADAPAGHHLAQKFGNDPANPAHVSGDHDDLPDVEDGGVLLSRKTPDLLDLVFTTVPAVMVGDYLRAGWNKHPA